MNYDTFLNFVNWHHEWNEKEREIKKVTQKKSKIKWDWYLKASGACLYVPMNWTSNAVAMDKKIDEIKPYPLHSYKCVHTCVRDTSMSMGLRPQKSDTIQCVLHEIIFIWFFPICIHVLVFPFPFPWWNESNNRSHTNKHHHFLFFPQLFTAGIRALFFRHSP